MSLLADLLSRAKGSGRTPKDVPPQLRQILEKERTGTQNKRRLVLFGVLIILVVGLGAVTVYYLQPVKYEPPVRPTRAVETPPPATPPAEPEKSQPAQTAVSQEPARDLQPRVAPVTPAPPVKESEKTARRETTATEVQPAPALKAKSPEEKSTAVAVKRAARPNAAEEQTVSSEPPSAPARPPVQAADFSQTRTSALYLGRQAEQDGDHHAAIEHYSRAAELPPPDADVLNSLSVLYLKTGQTAPALQRAEAALALRPGMPSALVNAGIAAAGLGEKQKAETYLLEAVKVAPADGRAANNLGLFYEREGRWDEAIGQFRAVARGGNAEAYPSIGRVLEKAGRRDDAVAFYRQTLGSDSLPIPVRDTLLGRLKALQ